MLLRVFGLVFARVFWDFCCGWVFAAFFLFLLFLLPFLFLCPFVYFFYAQVPTLFIKNF
jgi:hypothetical protein